MNMAGKKDIMDTVKTFCNQKTLNEESQIEHRCWLSILLSSARLFGVDGGVGFVSPYSTMGSFQLLWSYPVRNFSPTKVSTW